MKWNCFSSRTIKFNFHRFQHFKAIGSQFVLWAHNINPVRHLHFGGYVTKFNSRKNKTSLRSTISAQAKCFRSLDAMPRRSHWQDFAKS